MQNDLRDVEKLARRAASERPESVETTEPEAVIS
jgi:hypothetical protein